MFVFTKLSNIINFWYLLNNSFSFVETFWWTRDKTTTSWSAHLFGNLFTAGFRAHFLHQLGAKAALLNGPVGTILKSRKTKKSKLIKLWWQIGMSSGSGAGNPRQDKNVFFCNFQKNVLCIHHDCQLWKF